MAASEYEHFEVSTTAPFDPTVVPRGCQRCGEETRDYRVIDGKDYCRVCLALMRLEEFHHAVRGPEDQ